MGEKAAALARMRQAGLPVPAGFVIEAAAFDEAIAALAPRIASHLATATDGMQALAEASRTIQELLAGLRLPPGLSEAVTAAYEGLVDGAAVAVRSSGTAEDLPGASFAGQYSSYLNVTGADSVVERMRDVWASLYSPQAIAYRDRQGVAHSASRMAVLVQRQLTAEAAGVLFTRDPMSGAQDRLLINATFGLGEGVVSGETAADSFSLDAQSLAVVERAVADKTTMVAMRPGGGIDQQPVPAARRREPSLSDERLADLGRLARSVQTIEGGHRDIEFAVVDGDVYLLQARPVTGVGVEEAQQPEAAGESAGEAEEAFPVDWDDAGDEQYAWTLAAGFSVPTPLHRFEEDVRLASARHNAAVFEETGVPMARNHILRFINGYPYVRGPDVSEDEVTARQRAHGALGQQYAERGESYYVAEIEPETRAALDRLGSFRRPANESLASRLEHLKTALETSGYVMGDLHWRMAGAGGAGARAEWPRLFHELTGQPEMDSGVLLQAIANKTTRMTGRLRGLARLVQADSALRELFAAREFGRLEQPPFNRRPAVRRFGERFRALLREYGRRSGRSYGSSTTFETPTWNLDHRVPLNAVATYAEQDLDELDRLEQEARRERQQAARRFRGALAPDRDQHTRFDLALRQAQHSVRSMENHNHLMEQGVAGVMREAIWWMGEALVRRDRLDAPDDAMHLSLDELREAASDEQGGDLRPLVRRRVAELGRRSQLSPPRYLGSGEPPPAALPPALRDAAPSTAGVDGDVLRGEPASRGRYTGRARLFTPGGERPEIERGDILVARNAGQDWTPILPLLGGIVLDEGAVFQHAALVAREYRVPCVIQTREATQVIHDGQRITIDGGAGVVELAPEGGE